MPGVRRHLTLLAVLLACAPAAGAQDIDWTGEPLTDDTTTGSLAVAHAFFDGQDPACGRIDVVSFGDPAALARADDTTCRIYVSRAYYPAGPVAPLHGTAETYCEVLVHEYGHLLGLRFDNPADPLHSPDPANVMYPTLPADGHRVPGCGQYATAAPMPAPPAPVVEVAPPQVPVIDRPWQLRRKATGRRHHRIRRFRGVVLRRGLRTP